MSKCGAFRVRFVNFWECDHRTTVEPIAPLCLWLLTNIPDNTRVDLADHSGSATLNLSYSNIDHCDSENSSVNNSSALNCSGNSFNPRLAIANFCSVVNKQAELEVFLKFHKINLLVGTESHYLGGVLYSSKFYTICMGGFIGMFDTNKAKISYHNDHTGRRF